jgi:hypothetical protein
MLDAIELLHDVGFLERVGQPASTATLARRSSFGSRKATRLLEEWCKLGLAEFRFQQHRPNCIARYWTLTAKGETFLAMINHPPYRAFRS